MLRGAGTRGVPEIPVTSNGFTNTYSMYFDGVDQTIQTVDEILENVANFSVSLWFKQEEVDSSLGVLFGVGHSFAKSITLHTRTGDELFWVVQSGKSYNKLTGYTTAYPLDTWHNAVLVWDYSESVNADKLKLYMNGSLVIPSTNYGTFPSTTWNASLDYINVGAFAASPGTSPQYFFSGSIDEVAIWTASLSSGDASTIYNSGTPANLTSLSPQRWYRNGDSGTFNSNNNWEIPDYTKINNPSRFSFHFDGTDDYVNIGDDISALKPTGAFSVSAWVKFDHVLNTDQGIVQCGTNNGYLLLVTSADRARFYVYESGGWAYIQNTTPVNAGGFPIWYHLLGVWDGVDTLTLYVNGANPETATATEVTYPTTATHEIGRYGPDGGTNEMSGYISDVAIFNNDQNGNIASIYNNGTPTDLSGETGLVGYWKMGDDSTWDGSNWTIPDASSNSNNGTSDNMDEEDKVNNAPGNTNQGTSENMVLVSRVADVPPS